MRCTNSYRMPPCLSWITIHQTVLLREAPPLITSSMLDHRQILSSRFLSFSYVLLLIFASYKSTCQTHSSFSVTQWHWVQTRSDMIFPSKWHPSPETTHTHTQHEKVMTSRFVRQASIPYWRTPKRARFPNLPSEWKRKKKNGCGAVGSSWARTPLFSQSAAMIWV